MKFLIMTIALLTGLSAHSEQVSIERSRAVVPLRVELNKKTVRCLLGDYSSQSLKISLPDLRGITIFRQTTAGETAPCINAGSCLTGKTPDGRRLDPSLILDPSQPTEEIQLTVVLTEILNVDRRNGTCTRSLVESISAPVRGLEFKHQDYGSLGALDFDTCLKMIP